MDLELVSTKDLIDEVQKRLTFSGIIIWSSNEKTVKISDLKVFSTFDVNSTVEILDLVKEEVNNYDP